MPRSRSDEERFVSKQTGIVRRVLLRAKHGGFADLVFLATKEDADCVAEAEAISEHCLALFQIMQPPDPDLPDMRAELRTREDRE